MVSPDRMSRNFNSEMKTMSFCHTKVGLVCGKHQEYYSSQTNHISVGGQVDFFGFKAASRMKNFLTFKTI